MGLIQEFQKAGAQRQKEVAVLAREVAARRAEADAFVGHLHRVSADRHSEVAAMRAEARTSIRQLHQISADRRQEVAAMVAAADAFVRRLQQVRADRRKATAAMKREVAARLGDFRQGNAQRRREVTALRGEVATSRAEHRALCGRLHKLSAARHVEVWGRRAPAPRAAPPPPPGAPTTLRDVIFTYLAEHPDGAKLTQMEQDMRIARIRIARAMRGLIDEKKVQKREMLYFAV